MLKQPDAMLAPRLFMNGVVVLPGGRCSVTRIDRGDDAWLVMRAGWAAGRLWSAGCAGWSRATVRPGG